MIKTANIIRYVTAIVLPLLLLSHPIAGILVSFGVLWLNNYVDDIFFYLSSLGVRNKSFCTSNVVSPVNGIVTEIKKGVDSLNLKKRDCLDTSDVESFGYDIIGSIADRWKSYDHIAIYLNKFNRHIVLHPDMPVSMWKHYSDGNLEMVSFDSLVADNVGSYLNNDALVLEYPNCIMVLTMDKYISEYWTLNHEKGVCCQIVRGSQCDLFFKSGTFLYPKVGDVLDVYDPVAGIDVARMSYDVEQEAKNAVSMAMKAEGGYRGLALSALHKSLSTFRCMWMLCFVVILPALAYVTPLHTLFSYVGFSSIYLFLFVRSYRHLMYSLMNVIGLKDWMVNSYKFIGKAHKLWKK